MSKMILVNLPVSDLAGSARFYTALGGTLNRQFSNDQTSSIMFSDAIGVMLLTHEHYRQFGQRPIGAARRESQSMMVLTEESRDAVNATLTRAVAAGGRADPNPPRDLGFMYNRHVEDPDGYVWELVWLDPTGRHWRSPRFALGAGEQIRVRAHVGMPGQRTATHGNAVDLPGRA